jgi:hypothetical protein
MQHPPPTQVSPEQRNGRTSDSPQPSTSAPDTRFLVSDRTTRLASTGYWVRWTLGVVALIAMLNGLGVLLLFMASQVPASLLVYAMGLATLVGLVAVVVSPPVYAPPTEARLGAEARLRHQG